LVRALHQPAPCGPSTGAAHSGKGGTDGGRSIAGAWPRCYWTLPSPIRPVSARRHPHRNPASLGCRTSGGLGRAIHGSTPLLRLAQIDDRLRRAIIERDAHRRGRQHAPSKMVTQRGRLSVGISSLLLPSQLAADGGTVILDRRKVERRRIHQRATPERRHGERRAASVMP
jgi:hypothetical protein